MANNDGSMAYAKASHRFVKIAPDIELAYLLDDFVDGWKQRPVVLMLHGIAESGEAFNGWVPYLARHCTVIRLDLRGFGCSSPLKPEEMLSIGKYADEVDAFVSTLGLTQVHLIGAKLGAQIGLYLAQRNAPWIASLTLAGVLISPATSLGKWIEEWISIVESEGVQRWAQLTMPGRMGASMDPKAMQWWASYMGKAPAVTVKACLRMLPSLIEPTAIRDIECPTHVIAAVKSENSDRYNQQPSLAYVRRWQQKIPNSSLSEIEADSYHVAATHPDQCAKLAMKYLEELLS